MAWHQGVKDLFNVPHMQKVFEYHASIMLKEVPEGITAQEIKTPYGFWYEPVWEIALNHIQGRCGKNMPKTEKWAETFRPERVCFHWGGGTMTHYRRL